MGITLPPQEGLRGVLRAYPSFPGVFVGKGGVRVENEPLSKKFS